ncbi:MULTISPECIES: hypothetical protein [unclassified Clostridium]|uniref:hypothetical protein n=1 Tax=unclassified Clostridium TaxID=2614128 RepID=UPI00029729F4|nr:MULTISPECIES: hypothetical protein [unclassified Clostridium]EKQ52746.1 MAG: hypothetical protein A370_04051 [Clostridium sp. Maddingley MBC34-26]
MTNKSNNPVPRYVINFDEFIKLFGDDISALIARALKDKYPQITTNNIEAILQEIEDLMPAEQYKKITKALSIIINNNKVNGIQKIEGRIMDVPPIIQSITETFKFEKDVYITGFHFNQTGWKKEDRYTLEVNKLLLINKSFTKELGEHKYLNTYYLVNANTPINFTIDNNSGNSRQTIIDLEYLEKVELPPPPDPPPVPDPSIPSVDNITNPWDVAVEMNWEISHADIDLHGFIDGNHTWSDNKTHVWYHNKDIGDDTFKLNWDFQSHLDNTNPEILSVKGHNILDVYIHNFNPTPLNNPVNVKIYTKDSTGIKVIKEYDITLSTNRTYIIGVCSINLNTLVITDRTDQILFISP